VKVTLIPSSMTASGLDQHQYTTTYLINDTLAVDAGSIGFYRSPIEQAEIQDVLISHTHADHVASLPIFIENAFDGRPNPVTIHGSRVVLDSLQNDIFNGRIWPDFIGMSQTTGPVFLKINELESGKMIELQGLKITPVSVDHLVPTLGFVIDDGVHCIVIASDTGPTEEIWKVAHATTRLKAVFLETAFPNAMTGLAKVSKHLTPAMFGEEARKLDRQDIDLIVVHIKPRFYDTIVSELEQLGLPNIKIGRFNETYNF
jgi:ribonuclease BN (tRNA processing enzyme)